MKRTSIERAVVRMVVTPAKQISVQALYRMRSARQRLAVQLPAGAAFDAQPLRINGRPVALEKGEQNEYLRAAGRRQADKPFVLELRYTLPATAAGSICRRFPQEPAVVQGVSVPSICPRRGRCWACAGRGPRSSAGGPIRRWRWQPMPCEPNRPTTCVHWVREGVDFPAVRPTISPPTAGSMSTRRCGRPPAAGRLAGD